MLTTQHSKPRHSVVKYLSSMALISCLCAAALSVSWAAYAETNGVNHNQNSTENSEHRKKREPNWQHLAQRLNLDDNQKTAFIAMMSQHHQRRVELHQSSGLRQAMQEMDIENEQELANILSEEQLSQFISHREERKLRRHSKRKNKRGNQRV